MLTEQGNDVYCAKKVTFFGEGCRFALQSAGGGEQSGPRGDRWSRASYCNWSVNTLNNLIDSWQQLAY